MDRLRPPSYLPAQWRRWLARQLMQGVTPKTIAQKLVQQGFSQSDIWNELEHAQNHPYIQAGKEASRTVKKRDWLLTTLEELSRLGNRFSGVERMPLPPLREFLAGPYAQNRPVIFTGAMADWPALKAWNIEYLKAIAGNTIVHLRHQEKEGGPPDFSRSQKTTEMPLRRLLEIMRGRDEGRALYMTARYANNNQQNLTRLFEDLGQLGEDYLDTDTKHYNPYIWMGPKDIVTPLHHDLNNILFAQLMGKKRFHLYNPCQTPFLYNQYRVYSAVNPEKPDLERFPNYAQARPLEFTLNAGEILFIPVGWWHSYRTLEASISVGFVHLNMPNHYHHSYMRQVLGNE